MTWHVAASLQTLLAQLNALAPNRSKASDGAIGDAAHASRTSDHNPWYNDTVTARDFTNDPTGGLDCQKLADALVLSGDKRIKYIIWNRRIWQAGSWRPYSGINPHTKHLHLSVVASPLCESTTPWNLPGLTSPPTEVWTDGTYCQYGDSGDRVWNLQRFMVRVFPRYNTYTPNGYYGNGTKAGIATFQANEGITGPDADGSVVGPATMRKLTLRGFRP